MEILHTALAALCSIAVIFVLTRLLGNRQVGQMSLFDYINGITIGSIAAEMATNLEHWPRPLTAMVLYGLAGAMIDWLCCKSLALRRLLAGRPVVLYEHGKLYEKNLAAARLDVHAFLAQCRCGGYFSLDGLEAAVLEPNGQVSFLPKAAHRPATPADLGLSPAPEGPCVTLVADGQALAENLRLIGKDEAWLRRQLACRGAAQKDVFLALYGAGGQLFLYRRTEGKARREMFD